MTLSHTGICYLVFIFEKYKLYLLLFGRSEMKKAMIEMPE